MSGRTAAMLLRLVEELLVISTLAPTQQSGLTELAVQVLLCQGSGSICSPLLQSGLSDVHIRSHEISISDPSVDSFWALKEVQAPCDGEESPICLLLVVPAPGQNEARGAHSTNICWMKENPVRAGPCSPRPPLHSCRLRNVPVPLLLEVPA